MYTVLHCVHCTVYTVVLLFTQVHVSRSTSCRPTWTRAWSTAATSASAAICATATGPGRTCASLPTRSTARAVSSRPYCRARWSSRSALPRPASVFWRGICAWTSSPGWPASTPSCSGIRYTQVSGKSLSYPVPLRIRFTQTEKKS